jgi:hypothetical protein
MKSSKHDDSKNWMKSIKELNKNLKWLKWSPLKREKKKQSTGDAHLEYCIQTDLNVASSWGTYLKHSKAKKIPFKRWSIDKFFIVIEQFSFILI